MTIYYPEEYILLVYRIIIKEPDSGVLVSYELLLLFFTRRQNQYYWFAIIYNYHHVVLLAVVAAPLLCCMHIYTIATSSSALLAKKRSNSLFLSSSSFLLLIIIIMVVLILYSFFAIIYFGTIHFLASWTDERSRPTFFLVTVQSWCLRCPVDGFQLVLVPQCRSELGHPIVAFPLIK